MLEVSKQERIAGKLPNLAPDAIDRVDIGRLQSAPAVQLIARDAFVADMVIKVDQLRVEIKALARNLESQKESLVELREDTERNYRFSKFQEDEQRAGTSKVDDMTRRYRELKTRLDKIDGQGGGNYHAYSNFESVSRRLTDLSSLQREFKAVERKLKLSAGFFCGSVVLWLFALIAR